MDATNEDSRPQAWTGEARTLTVSIGLDSSALSAVASLRDAAEPGRAWVLSTDEALRVAAMLRDAARAADNANRVAARMKQRGEPDEAILATLEEMLVAAAGKERTAYRRPERGRPDYRDDLITPPPTAWAVVADDLMWPTT